jgi:hypothetical protein
MKNNLKKCSLKIYMTMGGQWTLQEISLSKSLYWKNLVRKARINTATSRLRPILSDGINATTSTLI